MGGPKKIGVKLFHFGGTNKLGVQFFCGGPKKLGSIFILRSNFYFGRSNFLLFLVQKNGGPIILFWVSKKNGGPIFWVVQKKLGSNFFGGAVNF